MKKTAAVSKRCPYCKIVRRRKRSSKKGGGSKWVTYVYCSSNPRHKQKQG